MTKTITWAIREVANKKIRMVTNTEHEAVEFAAQVNKQAHEEIFEVVKVVTTVEIIG